MALYSSISLIFAVLYAPKFNVGELGLDMQVVKTREEVWKGVSNLPVSKMDTPIPFYPETAGYEVCRITRGSM